MNKKFRVWDKKKKKFKYDGGKDFMGAPCNFFLMDNGQLAHGYLNAEVNDIDEDDYIVQFFTGLEDTNGREVYEGDRVRVYQDPDYVTGKTAGETIYKDSFKDIFEGIVKYHHGSYHVFGENDKLATLSNFWVGGDYNKIEVL